MIPIRNRQPSYDPSRYELREYHPRREIRPGRYLPHFSALPASREAGLYGPADLKRQTLTTDRIIRQGYLTVMPAEPIAAMTADRRAVSWMSLDDAIRQIRRRYAIYEQHTYEMQQGELTVRNAARNCWRPPGWLPEHDPEVAPILRELELQQRQERVSLWRDVSNLRQAVPSAVRDYLDAVRTMGLLNGTGGESK